MNIDTLATILIALAPALTAVLAIIAGVVKIIKNVKTIKPQVKSDIDELTNEIKKSIEDIGVIKSRIRDIENEIIKNKTSRR